MLRNIIWNSNVKQGGEKERTKQIKKVISFQYSTEKKNTKHIYDNSIYTSLFTSIKPILTNSIIFQHSNQNNNLHSTYYL